MMVFKLSMVEELKKTYKDFDIYIQCIQCTQNQNIVLYTTGWEDYLETYKH